MTFQVCCPRTGWLHSKPRPFRQSAQWQHPIPRPRSGGEETWGKIPLEAHAGVAEKNGRGTRRESGPCMREIARSVFYDYYFVGPCQPPVLVSHKVATRKKAVSATGKVLVGGFSASEGIRELLGTHGRRVG